VGLKELRCGRIWEAEKNKSRDEKRGRLWVKRGRGATIPGGLKKGGRFFRSSIQGASKMKKSASGNREKWTKRQNLMKNTGKNTPGRRAIP